jgi:CRP-like cAMP-binding protein
MSSNDSSTILAKALETNRLLALLNREARQQMLPTLTLISLDMSQPLYEPGQEITHVYFPVTAVTSLLSEMEDGATVEIATIGREGMVGLPVFLGDESTFLHCASSGHGAVDETRSVSRESQ